MRKGTKRVLSHNGHGSEDAFVWDVMPKSPERNRKIDNGAGQCCPQSGPTRKAAEAANPNPTNLNTT